MQIENKNTKQSNFNQVKGVLKEKTEGIRFCSVTINVGHEQKRPVNLCCKRVYWDEKFKDAANVGDNVTIRFYLTSRLDNGRWNTVANILAIYKD